jgi:hypothetical protein
MFQKRTFVSVLGWRRNFFTFQFLKSLNSVGYIWELNSGWVRSDQSSDTSKDKIFLVTMSSRPIALFPISEIGQFQARERKWPGREVWTRGKINYIWISAATPHLAGVKLFFYTCYIYCYLPHGLFPKNKSHPVCEIPWSLLQKRKVEISNFLCCHYSLHIQSHCSGLCSIPGQVMAHFWYAK